jgi:hypothetical protein
LTGADTFLDRLRASGVSVSLPSDGKLWLQPKDALTPELLAEARTHKDDIVALLRVPQPIPDSNPAAKSEDDWPDRLLSETERQRIRANLDALLARQNEATNARRQKRQPDESAISACAAELLAEAQANRRCASAIQTRLASTSTPALPWIRRTPTSRQSS